MPPFTSAILRDSARSDEGDHIDFFETDSAAYLVFTYSDHNSAQLDVFPNIHEAHKRFDRVVQYWTELGILVD